MTTLNATADAETLIRRVSELVDSGRTRAARPLLAAARKMAGPSATLARLAAQISVDEGDLGEAQRELDVAIAAAPDHATLRLCRAELRRRNGDIEGAARDAAEAVIADRRDPTAKALLGTMMLELGRTGDAVACLSEAVAERPADPWFREALAVAQEADQDSDAALATLDSGIEAAPGMVGLRNAAILLCIRRRDFTRAVRIAEEARTVGVVDACLFGLKGHALSSLARHEEAADAYKEALKLGPEDPYVRHLVAASGALPGARRAPPEYLRTVFDGYADRFETHLISLGYRMPGLIRAVMMEHPALLAGRDIGPALDLGCGTGLAALAISDMAVGPITGVEISPRMLAQARAKQLYGELCEIDLIRFLAQTDQHWPLVLAADVFCYFGALDEAFTAVHARMEPAGWFIFSVETLVADHDGNVPGNGDWSLQRLGRYAHSTDYVIQSALRAGFHIRILRSEPVRFEAGVEVPGLLVVLERIRHDG